MSDQRLPPFAPPTDAAVLEEQARNPGTPSGYYFGDDASNNVPMQERVSPISADHRYWQTVILREDQVDLIARRVVELLHEDFEEDTGLTEPPPAGVDSDTAQEEDFPDAAANRIRYGDDAPGINSFVEHNRLGLGTKQVRTQLYRPDDPPPVPEEQRMLAVEVTPLAIDDWDPRISGKGPGQ